MNYLLLHHITRSLVLLLPAGEVQAFYDDLNGRQYLNEVFNFSVDKLYDLLFTDSQFLRDFMEQRRFSGKSALPPSLESALFATTAHGVDAFIELPTSNPRSVTDSSDPIRLLERRSGPCGYNMEDSDANSFFF